MQPHSFVIAAGTAPYGDPPGVDRMAPVVFLRGLFCLTPALQRNACADPPRFDALDHHPYAGAANTHARLPGDIAVPDLERIRRVMRAGQRAGHLRAAQAHAPLWITELAFPAIRTTARTAAHQAAELCLAFYELWRQGVSHVFWFTVRDRVPEGNTFDGVGLYLRDGDAKPAAAAFRFPFVARGAPGRTRTLWGRAPVSGTVAIEALLAGGWRPVLQLRSTAGGVFYAVRSIHTRAPLRARVGSAVSLPWSTD